jgi:hypothetical protein
VRATWGGVSHDVGVILLLSCVCVLPRGNPFLTGSPSRRCLQKLGRRFSRFVRSRRPRRPAAGRPEHLQLLASSAEWGALNRTACYAAVVQDACARILRAALPSPPHQTTRLPAVVWAA